MLPPPPLKENTNHPANRGWRTVRTGLLIAGSAMLGGLAVVFWNRKSLARLHQPGNESNEPSVLTDVETE
jgi:hypothetical protein